MEEVYYDIFTTKDFDKGIWGQMKRVALNQNGEVVGYHHPDDTNKWEDGSEVDWEEYEALGYNCMVQIPIFYYRTQRKTVNGMNTYRAEVSAEPREGFKHHPAFERDEGVIENYQYMSAFEGWIDEIGRLRSLPHKNVTNNITRAQARNAALVNGNNFTQQDFYLTSAIQMLALIELGGFDAQSRLANGNMGPSYQRTGLSLSLGNKSGGDDTFMSYRGIENLYMNYEKWIDGVNLGGTSLHIAKKNFTDNVDDGNYEQVYNTPSTGNIADFFWSKNYDFIFTPAQTTNGSSAIPDSYYLISSPSRLLTFGGNVGKKEGGGLFAYGNIKNTSDPSIASRLQYIKA